MQIREKNATNGFEKDFFKLMNSSTFDKKYVKIKKMNKC